MKNEITIQIQPSKTPTFDVPTFEALVYHKKEIHEPHQLSIQTGLFQRCEIFCYVCPYQPRIEEDNNLAFCDYMFKYVSIYALLHN